MKRILIIEDDEKLRCELETFLNKNGFVATSLNKFDNISTLSLQNLKQQF